MAAPAPYSALHPPLPPFIHSWANWQPKGPARRLTGAEVAVRVYGRGGPDDAAFGAFVEQDREMLYGSPEDWGPV